LLKGAALVHLVKGVAIVFFLLSSVAAAADGSFSGTVTDPAGAVVANVAVSITNVNTGKQTELETGSAGSFGPISLPSGKYKIRIQGSCFKPYSRVVKVEQSQSSEIKIALQVNGSCMD
jgi:hypothetical protein